MKYFCVDIKSFYASVECVERNLDPDKVSLAVCDPSRGNGAIFLAATPHLKRQGVSSRARLFDVPKHIQKNIILAKPRMKKYIEYSGKVFSVYLEMFSLEDIYSYSVDEVFIDVTPYLNFYNMTCEQLAKKVIDRVKEVVKLDVCIGAGDNMFLAKVSLDILAKHQPNSFYYLNKEKFVEQIHPHEPIRDIWRIGYGTQKRLLKYGIRNLGQLANFNQNLILKEFGIIGVELLEHANAIDTTTIKEIKAYKPLNKSFSHSQILFHDYKKKDAIVVVLEMVDIVCLKLIAHKLKTSVIGLSIGYSKDIQTPFSKSIAVTQTNSYEYLSKVIREVYEKFVFDLPIRKISIGVGGLSDGSVEQLSLFSKDNVEEVKLFETINDIKNRFGKNAVNRAISYTEEGNQVERNKLVGGHNGE